MPPELTGVTGRFWMTDLSSLAQLDEAANNVAYADADKEQFVRGDRQLASLVGSDPLSEQHQNRANLFAATHPAPPNQAALEEARVDANAAKLNLDRASLRNDVQKLALEMNKTLPTADRFDEATLAGHVRTALDKLLASKQVTDYCEGLGAPRDLTVVERLEVKNAALGLVKLLQAGKLDAKSLVHFVDSEAYDFRNAADLVRVADKTRVAVKANFVDRKGVEDVQTAAGNRINLLAERGLITARQKTELWMKLATLAEKGSALVDARADAARILDEGPKHGSPDKSLKQLREAFRGFRYDLDLARGALMPGRGEAFRRFCDDLGHFGRPRVAGDAYRNLRQLDAEFNALVSQLDAEIGNCLARQGTLNDQPEEARALGDAMRAGVVSVDQRAQEVTDLTHETNDMIRAHFQSDDSFSREMHELLDTTARHGGHRTVTIGGGVDVGFDVKSAGVKAKAGAGGNYQVSIDVPKGGGKVSVTWLGQGGVEASAKFGTSAVKVKAEGEIKGGGGRTVTYDTLDDAIRALKGGSVLTAGSANGLVLRGIGKVLSLPFRMLGSGVAKILRWTGALAEKVKADNLAFRDHVKASGALDAADEILSLGKNALAKQKVGFRHVTGSVGADVDATKLKAKFGGNYTYFREFGVKRTVFTPFAASLLEKSAEGRRAAMAEEGAKLTGDDPREATLLRLMGDVAHCSDVAGARACLDRLGKCLDALESGAQGELPLPEARRHAQRFRFAAAAYACLDRILADHASESDAARTELETTRKLFMDRLANPAVELPEKVFDEMLVTKTAGRQAGRARHTVEVSAQLNPDLFSGLESLSAMPTNFVAQYYYGPSTKLTGRLEIDRPVEKTDPRPWKNATGVTIGVKVTQNLPLGALLGFVADQVAAHTAQKPQDVMEGLLSGLVNAGLPIGVGGIASLLSKGIGKLFMESEGFRNFLLNAGMNLAKFAGKLALKLPVEAMMDLFSVMETEGEYDSGVTLSFGFKDGRFQTFSCADELKTSRKIGVRPGGVVGAYVETGVETSENRQCVFVSPTLDTAMEKFDDSGDAAQFHAFVTDNATGMLKLFGQIVAGDDACRQRENEAHGLLGNMSQEAADGLRARLVSARQALLDVGANDAASDFRKLRALEDYVGALASVFRQASLDA